MSGIKFHIYMQFANLIRSYQEKGKTEMELESRSIQIIKDALRNKAIAQRAGLSVAKGIGGKFSVNGMTVTEKSHE